MIITFQKLGERIGISRNMLHVYLGHFSLTKYVTRNIYEPKHALSVKISTEFITDFLNYLTKRRNFDFERIKFIKKELKELLNCEIHQEMCTTTCTKHKITA